MEFLHSPICLASIGVILFITVPFIIIRIFVVKSTKQPKKQYHPIAGTIFNQLLNFHRLHDFMTDHASTYRSYRLLSIFRSEVYTTDPANIEYFLKTNFQNYSKGWYNYIHLKDLLGDGIFAVDGELWRHQRKAASYEFSTKVLRD